jgi:hypothetical protein
MEFLEMQMQTFKLSRELETQVYLVENEMTINQVEMDHGEDVGGVVYFSVDRARIIAAELLRLADEFDGAK